MKKTNQIQNLLFFGTLILIINACTKEGPVGPKGDTGAAGQNGHTNVSSYNFTVSSSSWSYNSPSYYVDLTTPALTTANNDSASVMVYFNTGGYDWFALPYTQYNSASSNYFMEFYSQPNDVQVTWVNNGTGTGSDPNTYYTVSTMRYKVVVIPPNERKAHPNVNHHNYEEVKAAYNLKD